MKYGYLVDKKFREAFEHFLGYRPKYYGELMLSDEALAFNPWVQQVWSDLRECSIESIGDAAQRLRRIQRDWVPYSYHLRRRTELIAEKLRAPAQKTLCEFPALGAQRPLGVFALVENERMMYSNKLSSQFPLGQLRFDENHQDPPSRAYLKLWEAFTRMNTLPQAGERCMDLGASPGGWTWVLANLNCKVIAVDRTPLDDKLMKHDLVEFAQASAFAMQPSEVGPVDWIFSDVICYPQKLLTFVRRWIESQMCSNFICTLKFQGADNYEVIKEFLAIPNSHILHLTHNKHELTWVRLSDDYAGMKIDGCTHCII
jgi:23S rRNA (cytidine2498-2'-O)-methyltransferase